MKLNFNFPVKEVDGTIACERKEISGMVVEDKNKPISMHKVVANTLMSPNVKIGDVCKKYTLATTISSNKEIEVDAADLKLIKEIANAKDVWIPLVQAQLLMYLETIKE